MLERSFGRLIGFGALAALLMLGACATVPQDPDERADFEAENDPIEPFNRAIFGFNEVADEYVLRPVAVAYRDVVPEFGRDGLRNALDNLRSPIILVNDLLQGDFGNAGDTVARFAINSTLGILGFADVATRLGIEKHGQDFGKTFAIWGIGEGPYLVLPILGPSNPRDATGLAAEWVSDPFDMWMHNTDRDWAIYTRTVVNGVDLRSRNIETIDELRKTSIDFYAAVRSLYRQRRAAEIRGSQPSQSGPTPTPMGWDDPGTPSNIEAAQLPAH